jgi:hypothetical protein
VARWNRISESWFSDWFSAWNSVTSSVVAAAQTQGASLATRNAVTPPGQAAFAGLHRAGAHAKVD